jgi:hypothetical protein
MPQKRGPQGRARCWPARSILKAPHSMKQSFFPTGAARDEGLDGTGNLETGLAWRGFRVGLAGRTGQLFGI